MHTIKLAPYISIGESVRWLLDVQEGTFYTKRPDRHGKSCQQHLHGLLTNFVNLGFKVTMQAYLTELQPWAESADKRVKETGSDFALAKEDASALRDRAAQLLTVLRHEAVTQTAWVVTDKRISTAKLLGDVAGLFGEFVFDKLPELARYDFQQAGRCVALDVPTAGAFHVLRGTECVLRMFHQLHLPESHLELEQRMWARILNELRAHEAAPSLPKEVLDNLDIIRRNYRNPTQHPEKKYDADEVQDLFNICIGVVNSMVKDLMSRDLVDTSNDIPF